MPTTFTQLLLAHATERPDAAALREKKYGIWQTLTWRALAELTRELSGGLAEAGLRRGVHIAVIGENRPRLYAAMLAAQSLGAVPVPLYQDAVAAEFVFPLDHADVHFAIAEGQEQIDKLLEIRTRCPKLARIWFDEPRGLRNYREPGLAPLDELIATGRAFNASHAGFFEAEVAKTQAHDVAAMFFTSGTTGHPKGVVHTHASLIDRAMAGARFDRLTHDEEVLAYLPPAWIGQNIFSYAQWLACGYVVNCPESAATVAIDLNDIGPTYYFAPPRVFEGLLTAVTIRMKDASAPKRRLFGHFMALARRVGPRLMDGKRVSAIDRLHYALGRLLIYGPLRNTLGFSRVRVAYTAGEAIGPDLFSFYRSIGINLKQLYGSTETAVFVCLQPDHEARADTVGVPIEGVEIRLTDAGEILVRSAGLLKHYHRDPEATAQVLDADGWYRTGDAGFIDPGGHLRIIDRAKDVGRLTGGAHDGAMFAPKYLENKLKFFPHIKEAVAVGDRRETVCALPQHRHRGRRRLGRAAQPALRGLRRPRRPPRSGRARARLRRESQRRPRCRRAPLRLADHALSRSAQRARRRRRRAHPHAQGAARLHRRALSTARRRALRRPARAVHRDAGEVRGRPQRQRLGHASDPRGEGVPVGAEGGMKTGAVRKKAPTRSARTGIRGQTAPASHPRPVCPEPVEGLR